ncbi:MAG: dienelactone hydrolase family protein [Candidatus Kapabacteria bacterium]|nr:dienelactone hydrolase family protein [Candidatus Kapabacteria bacterium]MBX7153526.1 dienelactone hydrolase family protein [Bacteroidota bacterium]
MTTATYTTENDTELHELLDVGGLEIIYGGTPLRKADKIIIMMHGGSGAQTFVKLSNALAIQNACYIVPVSERPTWFPNEIHANIRQNEPWLSIAINIVRRIIEALRDKNIPNHKIYFMGFAEGGSIVLEYVARYPQQFGGVIALAAGLTGDPINYSLYSGSLANTTVFLGVGSDDDTIPKERVNETEAILKSMNAVTINNTYPDIGHTISNDELQMASVVIRSKLFR